MRLSVIRTHVDVYIFSFISIWIINLENRIEILTITLKFSCILYILLILLGFPEDLRVKFNKLIVGYSFVILKNGKIE